MRIDINLATVIKLQTLTGIGLKKAETIVEYRQKIGGFESVDSLSEVPGIGTSIVDQNRQILTCKKIKQPVRVRQTKSSSSSDVGNYGKKRGKRATSCSNIVDRKPDPDSSTSATCKKQNAVVKNRRTHEPFYPSRITRSSGLKKDLIEDGLTCSSSGLNKSTVSNGSSSPQDGVHSEQDGTQSSSSTASLPVERSVGNRDVNKNCTVNKNEIRRDRDVHLDSFHGPQSVGFGDWGMEVGDEGDESSMDTLQSQSVDTSDTDGDKDDGEGLDDDEDDLCGSCCCKRETSSCKHQLIKRKSTLKEDYCPVKRICRFPCHSCLSCGHGSSALSTWIRCPISRQRIPSKENPPAGLQQWLDTFKNWTNAERLMALDQMIELCEPTQVRHMMQAIEPQFQRDFISLLPKELALHVLSFLDAKDLLQAAQTCRYWHILTEDNLLWREKCREECIDKSAFSKRKNGSLCSQWKALYLRQYQIEQNWRSGAIRPNKVLKGHDDHVITCLEYCNNKIVSGSDDNTLKVWSVVTGKCLRTLVGHTGGVWSSQMVGNTIISGSTDRTLRVWNADTGQCQHVLYGHSSTVRCMSLHSNKVVSGSRDATLRMWDIENGDCLHVLMGHVAAVRCVQYDGRRVVSGAYDYTVRVWDPDTEACIHTLQGHTNRVYSLQFDGVHIVSGSLDTSIRVWDVETGNCLHTLIGHQSLTSGLELKDNILVSGNADSTVKVWDITSGQCLQTLQGPHKHQSAVTCLQFSKKFVITSSDDGTVKIWDLKTGDFLRNLVSLDSGGSGGVVWRLRCSNTKLVCAVGSRNGTEETKLLVLDFDLDDKKL
ncbi:F-box/WD repeat-containing protein 7 isoform X2 [Patella vulgata]|nr:F-box/WD repeat-containing protein 7 isoform X2 [Patella vulgata]